MLTLNTTVLIDATAHHARSDGTSSLLPLRALRGINSSGHSNGPVREDGISLHGNTVCDFFGLNIEALEKRQQDQNSLSCGHRMSRASLRSETKRDVVYRLFRTQRSSETIRVKNMGVRP